MSFNSKQYLAHEERRMEPESVLVKGTRRRYAEVKVYNVATPPERLDEEADNRAQDEYLKSKGIIK
jgi:hypothetical protein